MSILIIVVIVGFCISFILQHSIWRVLTDISYTLKKIREDKNNN